VGFHLGIRKKKRKIERADLFKGGERDPRRASPEMERSSTRAASREAGGGGDDGAPAGALPPQAAAGRVSSGAAVGQEHDGDAADGGLRMLSTRAAQTERDRQLKATRAAQAAADEAGRCVLAGATRSKNPTIPHTPPAPSRPQRGVRKTRRELEGDVPAPAAAESGGAGGLLALATAAQARPLERAADVRTSPRLAAKLAYVDDVNEIEYAYVSAEPLTSDGRIPKNGFQFPFKVQQRDQWRTPCVPIVRRGEPHDADEAYSFRESEYGTFSIDLLDELSFLAAKRRQPEYAVAFEYVGVWESRNRPELRIGSTGFAAKELPLGQLITCTEELHHAVAHFPKKHALVFHLSPTVKELEARHRQGMHDSSLAARVLERSISGLARRGSRSRKDRRARFFFSFSEFRGETPRAVLKIGRPCMHF
jgi:hypothetical protein